jgi:A/G-specific adenine glycosylase
LASAGAAGQAGDRAIIYPKSAEWEPNPVYYSIAMEISKPLLAWYRKNRRQLPWRDDPHPYAVWVSEIMLQQTRVETVLPYFERWMRRFASIESLAQASQQEVLNYWEGLGYYSRARNLHRAAREVVEQHNGRLPGDVRSLRSLPGIGPYTAGAIASIAFGLDEPLVDGNVRRVLARLHNLDIPVDSAEGEKRLWALAREMLPPGRAGDYNQALMELGALVCTPLEPACEGCPLADGCQARLLGLQAERPIRSARAKMPHYVVTAAVIRREGTVLIAQRPQDGLLGGLWEFPGGKLEPGEDLQTCLRREISEELGARVEVGVSLGTYRHAYTHFKVTLHAFDCRLAPADQAIQHNGVEAVRWVRPESLGDFPMGKIDRQISDLLVAERGDG